MKDSEYTDAYKDGLVNIVRNADGLFVNVELFRQPAIHFDKYGYYTNLRQGSYDWIEFWEQERSYIMDGFTAGGVTITGNHYAYLNYSRIKAKDPLRNRKVVRFPDFWDGDYNYFWISDISRHGITESALEALQLSVFIDPNQLTGGLHLLILKARRLGYSLKSSLELATEYLFYRETVNQIASFDSKYAKDLYSKVKDRLNFFSKHTPFGKGTLLNNKENIHSGFVEILDGKEIVGGYNSHIGWTTFKDNPDALRGKDLSVIKVEESGAFYNLLPSLTAMLPCVKDGDYTTGHITAYGTSGGMESGATLGLAECFYNPYDYEFIALKNIWDDNAENTFCGYFHGCYMNKVGFYDDDGNSDVEGAIKSELAIRSRKKTSAAREGHIIEYPITPAEALTTKGSNIFPVEGLKRLRLRLLQGNKYLDLFRRCVLFPIGGGMELEWIDATNSSHPPAIIRYKGIPADQRGSVVIYEDKSASIPPAGLYRIGYDPVAMDEGSSLASVIVYKGIEQGGTKWKIAATYIGRMPDVDDTNRIALYLAKYFNAKVMHENMFIHVRNFFRLSKNLKYLEEAPMNVINNTIKNSKVNRKYGTHMTDELIRAGEDFLNQMLLRIVDFDDQGEPIYWYETLEDIGIIDELIVYNRKGNFDRLSSLFMISIDHKEQSEQTYTTSVEINVYDELFDFFGH